MKLVFSALLLVCLVLSTSFIQSATASNEFFCDDKCAYRCSKASAKESCLKYCGICCDECRCVPSGTSGNKDECPCYDNKKNSKGGPKCP